MNRLDMALNKARLSPSKSNTPYQTQIKSMENVEDGGYFDKMQPNFISAQEKSLTSFGGQTDD